MNTAGTNCHYIFLAATELHVKFQIVVDKGAKDYTRHQDRMSLANNFLHSICEQCRVYLNNVAVEKTNKYYRAYFENLLCYNNDAKENLLRVDFFFPESKKHLHSLIQMHYLQRQKNTQQLLIKNLLNLKQMEKFMVIYLILIITCYTILNLYSVEVQMNFVFLMIKR